MNTSIKFISFLNNFTDENNKNLIESIIDGYATLFEYPHAVTKTDQFVDFHVEDVINQKGKSSASNYVNDMINKLKINDSLNIQCTRKGEINHLDSPISNLDKYDVIKLLKELEQLHKFLDD